MTTPRHTAGDLHRTTPTSSNLQRKLGEGGTAHQILARFNRLLENIRAKVANPWVVPQTFGG